MVVSSREPDAARVIDEVAANRTFGVRVVRAADGAAEVALVAPPAWATVGGALHSAGLIAVVDAAGLAAIVGAATTAGAFDGVSALGAAGHLKFLRPARGPLAGHGTIAEADLPAVRLLLDRATSRARATTSVDVVDSGGMVVCHGTFDWRLRRRVEVGERGEQGT